MKLAGRTWRVHANSFFQVNADVAGAVVETMRDWLGDQCVSADTPDPLMVDLYSGVGLFSLALADRFTRLIAVESDPNAVRDLRNNLARDAHARGKSDLREGVVEKVTKAWKFGESPGGKTVDWARATIVADPPRAGLGKHVTNDLVALAPQRIYYLSCDPATLARDLRALGAGGYELHRARIFDMFPQTSHIETLVELIRGNPGSES